MSRNIHSQAPTGAICFFGFIGAAVWFISSATTLLAGALGVLKAII